MEDMTDLWQLPWPKKKAVYGDANLIPVGGLQPGQDEIEVKPTHRTKDSVELEPVFYHSLPEAFYVEVLQAFPIGAVIDLTAGEGCLARAAYQCNIPYAGMTFNEAHEAGIRTRLEGRILGHMVQEGHRLYDANFHLALKDGGISGGGKRRAPGADPRRRPRPPKAAPKPKPPSKKDKGAEEEEQEEEATQREDDFSNDGSAKEDE